MVAVPNSSGSFAGRLEHPGVSQRTACLLEAADFHAASWREPAALTGTLD